MWKFARDIERIDTIYCPALRAFDEFANIFHIQRACKTTVGARKKRSIRLRRMYNLLTRMTLEGRLWVYASYRKKSIAMRTVQSHEYYSRKSKATVSLLSISFVQKYMSL